MSMIRCPHCDNEISDKATVCMFCGSEVNNTEMPVYPQGQATPLRYGGSSVTGGTAYSGSAGGNTGMTGMNDAGTGGGNPGTTGTVYGRSAGGNPEMGGTNYAGNTGGIPGGNNGIYRNSINRNGRQNNTGKKSGGMSLGKKIGLIVLIIFIGPPFLRGFIEGMTGSLRSRTDTRSNASAAQTATQVSEQMRADMQEGFQEVSRAVTDSLESYSDQVAEIMDTGSDGAAVAEPAVETATEEIAETPQPASAEEETTQTTSASGVVDPELKAFLDSYEAFVDEYVAFMKRYLNDPTASLNMLNDYMAILERLEDFETKIDEYDTDDMSVADAAYYMEVTMRCYQKMMDIY